MLLTLTTTHAPSTALGFLLHKHPDRVQRFALPWGTAHVFFPEASQARCTAALLLELDPVALVRRTQSTSVGLEHYVNDRPFVASSFLSVALAQVLRNALGGTCKADQALAETPIPLEATVAVVAVRGGERFVRELFEPLGYALELTPHAVHDGTPPRYATLTLRATTRLAALLGHLYVLLPVLDDDKHYWVAEDEVEKLLRHGEGWLAQHPLREQIAARYLRHRRALERQALERLRTPEDEAAATDDDEPQPEEGLETPLSLDQQRIERVATLVDELGATSVVDLGCGEGKLLRQLLSNRRLTRVVGVDVSLQALQRASKRLRVDDAPAHQQKRLALLHGALGYRDARLAGLDVATCVEVIEHLDPHRLAAFARVLFGELSPRAIVITTPNVEYNARFAGLPAGRLRHADHRFEWTRAQFQEWATALAGPAGYRVRFEGIGEADAVLGAPTQVGVFER